MDINKRREEIIDETVKFYSTPSNRSVIEVESDFHKGKMNTKCVYIGPEGKQCAFARCVDTSKIDLSEYEGRSAYAVLNSTNGDNILKSEYQGVDDDMHSFWDHLQQLHDESENWLEEGGLSARGSMVVADLKEEFCDIVLVRDDE